MIIITGGAGFIGSNLAKYLESKNYEVVISDWTKKKERNLTNSLLASIVDPINLKSFLISNKKNIQIIIHLGAVTSTTETNAKKILYNNLYLSKFIWTWCSKNNVRFLYASSAATYGDGENGFTDSESINYLNKLQPLNLYGWSKHIFDQFAIKEQKNLCPPQWVGLKFFNVYGPNEFHKEDMKSVICKIYQKISLNLPVNLFKSHNPEFLDGGQLRDFIYVNDVVNIMEWFMENPKKNGIYNLGTGCARSFKDVANLVYKSCNAKKNIKYISTPMKIRDKYQYYTQADMSKIYLAGYNKKFLSLEEGIKEYVEKFLLKL